MADATIITATQLNNPRAEGALTPCVAAAGRHHNAIGDINATLALIEDGTAFASDGEGEVALQAAIGRECGALADFLNMVPASNADAAKKIAYLLSAPDLVDTLPEQDMRRFLNSLHTYLASTLN